MHVGNGMSATKIMNIYGMRGMTRSGCIFAPPKLPARSKDNGKAKTKYGRQGED